MRRRVRTVLGGTAAAVLVTTALPASALAVDPAAASRRSDDRPDAAYEARAADTQRAVDLVAGGRGKVESRDGSKAVRIAPGQWAQYGVQASDQVLTFLVEFGAKQDPRLPTLPGSGPVHNAIPEPDRAKDNSTLWAPSLDRRHFLDMFFGTKGESFKGAYEEFSSGRYTVGGDVSDWVKVPYSEPSYGQTESQADMTRFIGDSATAWYDAQKAAGKTDAQVKAYLAGFDKWDRYDYDKDGDFAEPDGYIDHFQAVHAGEDESAGAPSWAIWAHRWAVGQSGRGTTGPSFNRFGGVQIGDTGFWIRDYTTEPENGGLGVFAHEFGHDLGLPDLYDTSGGENGTGFWTLMSSGSWLDHGGDTIGTTPGHMGAWEKLQLGWLDYAAARAGTGGTFVLGPAEHATKKGQALLVELPKDAKGNSRYYIAENRQYVGYDATLGQGPYNFGWTLSKPDLVERFPYQDGVLVSYWNTAQTNNNTSTHPGEGLILPVDARARALAWSDGTVARNRIQGFDATFGVEPTDALSLHRETASGVTTLRVPSQAAVSVFDDSDPLAYYDAANPQGSVKVAGTGTRIRVVQTNRNGIATVQVR